MSKHGKIKSALRLDRLLGNLGYGTRSELQRAIRNGWVTYQGEELTNPAQKIDLSKTDAAQLLFDGQMLDPFPPLILIMHKPATYVCAHDEKDGPSAMNLLPHRFSLRSPQLSFCGRLDMDSTGLVLMSDDGQLLHRVTHPSTHLPKIYEVELESPLNGSEDDIFASGEMMLDGEDKPLKPVIMEVLSAKHVRMTLTEGRYHQIKRMFEEVGNKVAALHRTEIGPILLGDLPEGEWRPLSEDELSILYESVGL
ncbi:MAG: pseudouridine synthase [Pseudobdellovibrionaceae bacterium]